MNNESLKMDKLEDAIMVYNSYLDKSLCKLICGYVDKVATRNLTTHSKIKDYRKVLGHSLGKEKISDKIYFKKIYDMALHFLYNYKINFPQSAACTKLEQVDLLKYEPGGKYDYHHDNHGTASPRTLSMIINLNDEYEGGDLVFGNQRLNNEIKRVSLNTGSIVCFPSNFLFPHKIEPITKGVRYSIVLWLL